MATTPFAYNPSRAAIAGTTNLGDLSVGNSAQHYAAKPGGLTWWMGPEESDGYVIGVPVTNENHSTPVGAVGNIQFWKTSTLSDSEFLALSNYIKREFGGSPDLASASAASIWLAASGYYTNWQPPATTTTTTASPGGIVSSGLVFNLQTAPSSGNTWTDLSGNSYNATLQGTPTYVSNNGGGIKLNNPSYTGTDYISVPYNINSNTVTVEMVASFNPTSYWSVIWGNENYIAQRGYFAFMTNSSQITYGRPGATAVESITASNAIRHWTFVINGSSHSLYLNGSQIGTTQTRATGLFATGNFYFGSRHLNDGTGNTDRLNNSNSANYPVFYQMRVYNRALSSGDITTNFNAIKSTYGL